MTKREIHLTEADALLGMPELFAKYGLSTSNPGITWSSPGYLQWGDVHLYWPKPKPTEGDEQQVSEPVVKRKSRSGSQNRQRRELLAFRATGVEKLAIAEAATAAKLSVADFCRQATMRALPPPVPTPLCQLANHATPEPCCHFEAAGSLTRRTTRVFGSDTDVVIWSHKQCGQLVFDRDAHFKWCREHRSSS